MTLNYWKDYGRSVYYTLMCTIHNQFEGLSWSWSYGSWIYNYLCNQHLSPLKLRVRIPLMWDVLDTTLCDRVTWDRSVVFSGYSGFHHDITEILLKVALNTINQTTTNHSNKFWLIDLWIDKFQGRIYLSYIPEENKFTYNTSALKQLVLGINSMVIISIRGDKLTGEEISYIVTTCIFILYQI
jgi:hypothetical protein